MEPSPSRGAASAAPKGLHQLSKTIEFGDRNVSITKTAIRRDEASTRRGMNVD
jgi:hypothetical protein